VRRQSLTKREKEYTIDEETKETIAIRMKHYKPMIDLHKIEYEKRKK
jgi:hypothetical protein